MPDTATNVGGATVGKSGILKKLGFGLLAAIIILAGLAKTWRGVSQLFGWDGTSQFNTLLEESDAAYKAALAQAEVAQPLFQSVMTAVDAQGPADVRLEQGDNAAQAATAFKNAAQQFQLAGKKIGEALARDVGLSDDHTSSLTLRAKACGLLAEVCTQNANLCGATLDESFETTEALVAKILELAAKRDATQKEADAAIVASEELAKKLADK